ncbi:Carboxypeptidase Y A [Neolecta irregularis DAH-3]|uniref:Carboxypeptidase n=1 Tax=Neolecta irregularis (strain DAH-3) TaxID=1198029 RepID=A0A1U7LIM3_NEOID|nr:Carboxypeptidase Y A [Neolecta irregularis DAH-3]|eukprot:OLL22516.1 Carboxypeptidase Y A [Neolecta irregularis DAH-3]
MRPSNVLSSIAFAVLLGSVAAKQEPFIKQEDRLNSNLHSSTKDTHSSIENIRGSVWAHLDQAREALKLLSTEVLDNWEWVSKNYATAFTELTWTTPEKKATKKEGGWDAISTASALPDHQLRIKTPSNLGVDKVKQYSGYLDVSKEKHFFFWFFESRNDPKNDPVVLWLNGGPGCSSLLGLFMELGPATVNKDGSKLVTNPFSWNNNANMMFLDQPINVGYSYGEGSVSDTVAAGKDVYALLALFFKQFPEYSHQEFHIAGESYAGHYIPVFAKDLIEHTKGLSTEFYSTASQSDIELLPKINLKSVLIGNGLTDPLTQFEKYPDMACNNSYAPVLSESECQSMRDSYPRCASLIESCYNYQSLWTCVPASIYCNNVMLNPFQKTGKNIYDIRSNCEDKENLCYPIMGSITKYLNRPDVKEAVGAEVEEYLSCNSNVNRNFLLKGDWMKPYHLAVPQLLLAGIPVMIYSGDADFICKHASSWMGNLAWTEALDWPGKSNFNQKKLQSFGGKHEWGQVKSFGNFTFLKLHHAGHMVPYDQPESSLEMFNRWISGDHELL